MHEKKRGKAEQMRADGEKINQNRKEDRLKLIRRTDEGRRENKVKKEITKYHKHRKRRIKGP